MSKRGMDGISEIMKDCRGFLFDDQSQLNLSKIIESYMENKNIFFDNLKKNRAKIKNQYDPTNIIDKIYNLYRINVKK